MQVIVAFILEAFVFRIQYRMVMNGQDMDGIVLNFLLLQTFIASVRNLCFWDTTKCAAGWICGADRCWSVL